MYKNNCGLIAKMNVCNNKKGQCLTVKLVCVNPLLLIHETVDMPTFKIARKTFMTNSTLLDIPQSIGRTMLGQKDPSISAHYNNFDDPRLFIKVTQAHIKVLREFNIIDIYNIWLRKIDEFFGSNWHQIYGFSTPQDLLYTNFHREVENMVHITHTKIKNT